MSDCHLINVREPLLILRAGISVLMREGMFACSVLHFLYLKEKVMNRTRRLLIQELYICQHVAAYKLKRPDNPSQIAQEKDATYYTNVLFSYLSKL